MNFAFNELTRSVADKESLDDCNAYELKQLVNQYPFFGPLHLLLAKKLRLEEMSNAEQHIEKASLYFVDPLWFEYLLDEKKQQEPEINKQPKEPIRAEQEVPTTFEEVVTQKITREEPILIDEDAEYPQEDESPLPPIPSFKIDPISQPAIPETALAFEPYHTVDYFASQGIKVKDEDKPKDKFSQQLRSFTEWLKTMKRVPSTETGAAANPNEEKKVEQMAEKSITDREVFTEAMAEVWEKQGNHTKAIDIYKKLSLLDPAKSSYFAAKIDQLKSS